MREIGDTDLHSFWFELSSHKNSMLDGLNELRLKEQLVDITFRIEKKIFKAHRAVLASCSEYFRAMFSQPMKESEQTEIALNGVPAAGFSLLLDFIYTTKLELNLLNVQHILLTASHIRLDCVINECATYLEKQMDTDNCLDVLHIAETYFLTRLEGLVYKFISANLKQFLGQYEVQKAFTMARLVKLLSSNYPVNLPERDILQSVVVWWQNNDSNQTSTLIDLLKYVNLSQMNQLDIETVITRLVPSSRSAALASVILQARLVHQKNTILDKSLAIEASLINNRGMELALLTLGGFGTEGITNEICYFLPSKQKWFHLTKVPHIEQCNFGKAVLKNELYIVGGCYNNNTDLKEYAHPFGFRYSPLWNKWETISPMLVDRCLFSLNVISNKLYAIGGSDVQDGNLEPTGECYDPETDEWQLLQIPVENFPREQHAAAAVTNDHHLYISGGLDRNSNCLASFYRFNAAEDTWETLPPLSQPRADHEMFCVMDDNGILKIFVCGGYNFGLNLENRDLLETIECFDSATSAWEIVTRIPTPRFNAGITFDGQQIHIIGGYSPESIFNRKLIESYDLAEKCWTNNTFPRDVWENVLHSIYIPVCRDDDTEIT